MIRRLPLLALFALGCGRTGGAEADATSGAEQAEVTLGALDVTDVQTGPFVREIRGGCTQGEDACSVRGDCEAAPVDCGPPDERLRITAVWSSSDDIDLSIVEPSLDELGFLRPTGASGGRMILPAGRTCVPGATSGLEIATFIGPLVQTGIYRVELRHFGSCMSGRGTVDVDLTLSAGGHHLGSYRVSLAPTERSEALTVHTE